MFAKVVRVRQLSPTPRLSKQAERLVLNVAANQAAIGLEEARLRAEQYRITKDLDLNVAQQSKALISVSDERKKGWQNGKSQGSECCSFCVACLV